MEGLKRTALYESHKKEGAKLAPFNGWELPLWYSSVLTEHKVVREKVGIFDVSHMGEIFVEGTSATNFLQKITINDISKLSSGQGQYSAICKPDGGMIDDLILYKIDEHHYLICVNASNVEKDYLWLREQALSFQGTEVRNESENWSQIALQGPLSQEVLKQTLSKKDYEQIAKLSYLQFACLNLDGETCYLARTGYTGEKGYEIYTPHAVAVKLWQSFLEAKAVPIGLGARDTLRLESCFLLYGNDMDETVSPLEAGIAWATKLNKGEFVGQQALQAQKERGLNRILCAFLMEDKAIPRGHMEVFHEGLPIGHVTSGSILPSLNAYGGLCLVETKYSIPDTQIEIDIRGQKKKARIVKKPFYAARTKD